MSFTKRFLEDVSCSIGFGGEINLKVEKKAKKLLATMIAGKLICKDHGDPIQPKDFGGIFWGDPLCKKACEERENFLTDNLK